MTDTPDVKKQRKTWVRELATVMIIFTGVITYQEKLEELKVIVWPVTTFAMLAWGYKQDVIQDLVSGKKP